MSLTLRADHRRHVHMSGVDFIMHTSQGAEVKCCITLEALDELADTSGTLTEVGQDDVFDAWIGRIAQIANQKYEDGDLEQGAVVVRPEDVEKARSV